MTEERKLMEEAKKALNYAYAPYSKYPVGAALLTNDGRIFTGCNVENASYGATNCAERTAVFKAVSEGYRQFQKIAVASLSDKTPYPCGICLQVLMEFMPEGTVILEEKGQLAVYPVKVLLPLAFGLKVKKEGSGG